MTATEAFQSLFSLLYEYREELGIASFIVNATSLNDSVIEYDFIILNVILLSHSLVQLKLVDMFCKLV